MIYMSHYYIVMASRELREEETNCALRSCTQHKAHTQKHCKELHTAQSTHTTHTHNTPPRSTHHASRIRLPSPLPPIA